MDRSTCTKPIADAFIKPMKDSFFRKIADGSDSATPAFVFCEKQLRASSELLRHRSDAADCHLLYSVKANALTRIIELIEPHVNGLSACSQFEAKLVRDVAGAGVPIHVTTPHFAAQCFDSLLTSKDFVSFNSLSQYFRYAPQLTECPHIGIRVNPGKSFVIDQRYNPSRNRSKLGVPFAELQENWNELLKCPHPPSGIHFHNNCESQEFGELYNTVVHLAEECGEILDELEWVNLGGGYLFEEGDNLEPFYEAVGILTATYGLKVFVEPGAAFVRKAGYVVSEVVDMISRDGKRIAILDTTVNHMPEVFEFQYSPDVLGASDAGKYSYLLAGCSCLAGDLFGEYSFDEPLTVGSRVVFQNVGDYTTPKWHYFNGINLPSIYSLNENDELTLIKQFTYEDFASRYGVESNVVV